MQIKTSFQGNGHFKAYFNVIEFFIYVNINASTSSFNSIAK
jgi:hypothetical protein